MTIPTIVVDDELPARNEFKRFLAAEPDFHLVGEAQDGDEALEVVKRLKPQAVFLDIHMPKKDGLEVAGELSGLDRPPLVVFVTAFDQYAIEAFELNALDYILKPFDQERFGKACGRVRHALQNETVAKEKLAQLRAYLAQGKPVTVVGHRRNSRDRILVPQANVLFFHVELTDVTVHTVGGEDLLVNSNLRSLLGTLDPSRFQQTHRAYIVNLDQVEKVTPLFSGNFKLILKDPARTSIPLSRRYARKLKQFLKW